MALKKNKNVILTPKAEGSRLKYPVLCLAAAALFLLAACGDEVTEVTEVTHVVGMQIVEEGDALPKCTTENEGEIVYSVDSAAAYYCVNRTWTSMKGKDGVDGKNGKDGADGKNGKDGDNGADGKDGKNGADGKNCEIASDTNGVTTLKCGNDTTMLYKAMCGTKAYDPEKQSCCGTDIYDPTTQSCCGTVIYESGKHFCCGTEFYNPATKFCDVRDSQSYRYVTIAPRETDYSEVWMAENLNYADSVNTPSLLERSWCYNNEPDSCAKYGRLYTWSAAIDSVKLYKEMSIDCGYDKTCTLPDTVYGICPDGWHLPKRTEWEALIEAVGGAEKALEVLLPTSGWLIWEGTDAYGFSVLPVGMYLYRRFTEMGQIGHYWGATELGARDAYDLFLGLAGPDYIRFDGGLLKENGYSVRCVKD